MTAIATAAQEEQLPAERQLDRPNVLPHEAMLLNQ
jgi:hypothetical protein